MLDLLFALIASPAHADPITLTIASLAASASLTAAGVTGIAYALAQIAIGAVLMIAGQSMAKQRGGGQADLKRGLARPDELTPYRHVYGYVRTYGSPAPWRVKGDILYGCLIFNSRLSEGPWKLHIDQREVTEVGNPYALNGPGATGSESDFNGYLTYWIGKGTHDKPPQKLLDEAPEIFKATDIWKGCTVLWVRMDCGDNESRAERWPSVPPAIEMEGKWSRVWDPRDPAQSATNQNTWKWSANRTLCVLDALRRNPIRGYPLSSLMMDSFIASADVDDEAVPLKAGGTEPRYECNGVLIWDESEIEDQVAPLIEAGGGGITRIGGQIGMIPGAWQAPEITITDVLDDDGLTFDVLVPGEDLATAVRAKYMSKVDWEMADAGVYVVPGAQVADGGLEVVNDITLDFVTSHTQAQRLMKITAMQQRAQKKIVCVLPPDAFQAVGGTNIKIDWPSPFSAMNGNYSVQSIHPALDLVGQDGVAMRCPVELTETSASIWAWDAATEEQDVEIAELIITSRATMPPPSAITTTTGSAAAAKSGSDRARIKFAFAPVASKRVDAYEWQWREGGDAWQAGGQIDADIRDSAGNVFGFLRPVEQGASYDIRVRSLDGKTSASVWILKGNTTALGPSVSLSPPYAGSATTTGGGHALSWRLPGDKDVEGIEIYGSASATSPGGALLYTIAGGPSSTISLVRTGTLYPYYSAKTRGPYASTSGFSAVVTAT